MSESNATLTVTQSKTRTIIFDNHLPLRTRAVEHEIFLDYAYLDFGGLYFTWCACSREPGKYHCWRDDISPYSRPHGSNRRTYLGLFGSYEELLPLISGYDMDQQGKIISRLGEDYDDGSPGEIVIPEC